MKCGLDAWSIFGFFPISLPCIHVPSSHIHLVFPKEWGVFVTMWMEPTGLRGVGAMFF